MKWILLETVYGKNVMMDIHKADFITEERKGKSVFIKFSGDPEEYLFSGDFSSIWLAALNAAESKKS